MDLKQLPSLLLVTPLLRAVVAIHAVPAGAAWRRSCDKCGEPLRVFQRTQAFYPTGRCSCGACAGAPPYLVEIATVAAVALVAPLAALGRLSTIESLAVAWWAGWTIPLAFIDAAVHRLPDRLTYPAAAGTVALLALATAADRNDLDPLARASITGVGTAVIFAALTFALGGHGPGLGDAKLMLGTATLLGWFGWQALVIGVLLGLVAQGLFATAILLTRRNSRITHLPMGPFLIGGAAAAISVAA